MDYLTHKSYSVTYGARNLRRLIQKELEDEIALYLIQNYEHQITSLSATAKDGKINLTGSEG